LHVFTYSERPSTRAREIPHVVDEKTTHRRTRHMLAVSERMLTEFTAQFSGSVRPMLFEHPRQGHPCGGFTDNYLKVELQNMPDGFDPMAFDNRIVQVRLGQPIPERETVEGFLI
ncbi:MAG: hypothetical protein K2L80_08805, partial [Muribaculaceae bacterium]|nr:hypothetical protein [Muribaculaceae bacterium]